MTRTKSARDRGVGKGQATWATGKDSRGQTKEAAEEFVCAHCMTKISGEISLVQHVEGRKHRENAGRQPLKLLPNALGAIPALSQQARQRLGYDGPAGTGPPTGWGSGAGGGDGRRAAQLPPPQEPAAQKVGVCWESEKILRSVLETCGGPAESQQPPGSSSWSGCRSGSGGHGEQPQGSSSSQSWGGQGAQSGASQGSREPPRGYGDKPAQRRPGRPAFVPQQSHGKPSLRAARASLPVLQHRAEILDIIGSNQVCIVEGETGCGKTTQVAQYIVEDAAERGVPCSVVCTQPRRISAISVADRVADERGEAVGDSTGYSVRLENKTGPNTCLLFCTTGILLRRLEMDMDLEGTTHVVADEVHERGVESDFLLLALRDLCRRRADLKVILMSATMDKSLFGNYFGGAPGITVPGRTFPVEDFFLEDALMATKHVVNPRADWALEGGKGKGKGKGKDESKEDLDAPKREDLGMGPVQARYGRYGSSVQAALRGIEQDAVNYDLVVQLVRGEVLERMGAAEGAAATVRPTGVLIFMSGAKEIETMQELILALPEFRDRPARDWVLPLHGGLPTDDQRKVFLEPPHGVRKVVISTNVAETAVTINDIGYVVDTARMKEMRYDAIRCMSSLDDTVVSRTNARQRRGRAGRVAPGLCVHVGLTKFRHDTLIDDHQPPEVQRTPLEQLILRIHAARLHLRDPSGKAAAICARLLEPPNPKYVAKSVEQLVRLGALSLEDGTGRETLTALGEHLAQLPLEARLGKLVLFGAAFGPSATDAALTVAAALTSRNPFLAPLESREEARKKKRSFTDKMIVDSVGPSDHMAVLQAYGEWDRLPPSGDERWEFCRANFLSIKTLQGMAELKRSLLETLSEAGFVRRGLRAKDVLWVGRRRDGSDGVLLSLAKGLTPEPCPPPLIAALLCAALFPQVAEAVMPQDQQSKKWWKQQKHQSGENAPKPRLTVRDAETGEPLRVKMHPGSVSAWETTLTSPYLVYQDLVSSSQLYVRDVTPVPPLALALFSGTLTAGAGGSITVDGWIKLAVPARLQQPILEMRKRLDDLFHGWVGRRGKGQGGLEDESGAEVLRQITQLLHIQKECAPTAPGAPEKAAQGKTGKWAQQQQAPPKKQAAGGPLIRGRLARAALSAAAKSTKLMKATPKAAAGGGASGAASLKRAWR